MSAEQTVMYTGLWWLQHDITYGYHFSVLIVLHAGFKN